MYKVPKFTKALMIPKRIGFIISFQEWSSMIQKLRISCKTMYLKFSMGLTVGRKKAKKRSRLALKLTNFNR